MAPPTRPESPATTDQLQKRRRNSRGEGGRLKIELIEAAIRVLDKSATAELTLRSVAHEAGVSAQAIYAHFPDREAMTIEVIQVCWHELANAMTRAGNRKQSEDPLAKLQVQFRAYVRYASASPVRYQLLFALRPEMSASPSSHSRPVEPVLDAVSTVVSDCERTGYSLPMPDVRQSALLILSVVHGRIALAQTNPESPWNSVNGINRFTDQALYNLMS